jgi:hypothetical protein
VRGVRHVDGRPPFGTHRGQAAEKRDGDRRRRPGAATHGDRSVDADLHREIVGRRAEVDRGLDQRVSRHPGRLWDDRVRLAGALHPHQYPRRAGHLANRDLDTGRHRDVHDAARRAEPGVGPAAEVTDPDRDRDLDHVRVTLT